MGLVAAGLAQFLREDGLSRLDVGAACAVDLQRDRFELMSDSRVKCAFRVSTSHRFVPARKHHLAEPNRHEVISLRFLAALSRIHKCREDRS